MSERAVPVDAHVRDQVVATRGRNVVVDAGAGTGKTTLVVRRLLEMIAPSDDAVAPIPLERIAAVTFTRKAGGELKLRIRERTLRALAEPKLSPVRRERLHRALGAIDTAYVGTIHSFADRLLRLHPVEARLSPSYQIADDVEALAHETFTILVEACEKGTLAAELAGTPAAHLAEDATEVLLDVFAAGLRLETQERDWGALLGLDAVVEGMILNRDVELRALPDASFSIDAFRGYAREYRALAEHVDPSCKVGRWFANAADVLGRALELDDPRAIYRTIDVALRVAAPTRVRIKVECARHEGTANAWRAWDGDGRKKRVRDAPLRDDLLAPLRRWMALRSARLAPVVRAIYDRVKARHRVVDQIDLLLQLRDLLRDRKDARASLQALFDHVFIDEFQDTDPLQAEIALYLCERGAVADRAWDAELRPGSLTLVGDPKQSIYRFRRADVATYERVRRKVLDGGGLGASLTANFRSTPGLIDWFDDRFEQVLGSSPDGRPFDERSGQVFHAPLRNGRVAERRADVRVLPLEIEGNAPEVRAAEGDAVARYVRWLVEQSGFEIVDPLTDERRPVQYGDVAVLALVTTNLPLLFRSMASSGVPYASAGGTLFLSDPVHRHFLLGLRALADRDDGVAEAALLRPPFFAIDLLDVAWAKRDAVEPRAANGRAARDLVTELRKRRFDRSPGATARDLLERSAFARTIALGPNGAQRVRNLYELCLALDALAEAEGLDFDGATARARAWVDAPEPLDPPEPIEGDAVRVTTIHQAKGLEYPVVVLWDARQQWKGVDRAAAWSVARDGDAWSIAVQGLSWEEPPGVGRSEQALRYAEAERRRVVYVAATRARDLLIVPYAPADDKDDLYVNGVLARCERVDLATTAPPYAPDRRDEWPAPWKPRRVPSIVPAPDEDAIVRDLAAALTAARAPRFRRAAVSAEAHARAEAVVDDEQEAVPPPRGRASRFGPRYGTVVHRAIGLVLQRGLAAVDAVARAAKHEGHDEHLAEAVADVERAVATLRRHDLLRGEWRLEYPVAAAGDGALLVGSIDFVCARDGEVVIVDFKTDATPLAGVPPAYAEQVRAYARMIDAVGTRRSGLLFVETGELRWVST